MLTSLNKIRVLDCATLIAGPLAAGLLADLGAYVVKLENPATGDPLRGYPPKVGEVSLVNKVTNRNKLSATLNLRTDRGQSLFRNLASAFDIVVTNFRPRTLRRWGIDFPDLRASNDRLIMLHISGFGRSGPYVDMPGFARVAEGFAGLAAITGFPDREPVLAGYPIVDALAGVFGAFALMTRVVERNETGNGGLVDLGLYEPLLRILEDLVVGEGFGFGQRGRVGNDNPYVAPNGLFKANDGRFVIIPASTDTMFRRLMQTIGQSNLAEHPGLQTNIERVQERTMLHRLIQEFVETRPAKDVVAMLTSNGVAAGPINSAADIVRDPHIQERNNLVSVFDPESGKMLTMQNALPIGDGSVHFAARPLGADNAEVYGKILGLSEDDIAELVYQGIL